MNTKTERKKFHAIVAIILSAIMLLPQTSNIYAYNDYEQINGVENNEMNFESEIEVPEVTEVIRGEAEISVEEVMSSEVMTEVSDEVPMETEASAEEVMSSEMITEVSDEVPIETEVSAEELMSSEMITEVSGEMPSEAELPAKTRMMSELPMETEVMVATQTRAIKLENIITSTSIIQNGVEISYPFTVDDTVNNLFVRYEWATGETVEIHNGDYTEILIPEGIPITSNISTPPGVVVLDGEGQEVGRFVVDSTTRILTLTFNEKLEGLLNNSGYVQFNLQINKSDFLENTVKEIKFLSPAEKKYIIIYEESDTPVLGAITKLGVPNSLNSPESIEWTIDINKDIKNLGNISLEDIIPTGLTLDGMIGVYNLNRGISGTVTLGNKVTDELSFPIEMNNVNSAYRFIFKTTITDKTKAIFTNRGTLITSAGSQSAEATVINNRPVSIVKSGVLSLDKKSIEWTIVFNQSNEEYTGLKLEDTFSSNQTLVENSVVVTKIKDKGIPTSGSDVVPNITEAGKVFCVTFGGTGTIVAGTYEIKYKTTPVFDDYEKTYTFTNNAVFSDDYSKIGNATANVQIIKTFSIIKKGGTPFIVVEEDGAEVKYIPWKITVNKDKDDLSSIVITDTISAGHTLVTNSIVLTTQDGQQLANDKDYTLTINENVITIEIASLSDTLFVALSTKVEDYNLQAYKNRAVITIGGIEKGDVTATISGTRFEPVLKKVHTNIDYENQIVDWTVHVQSKKGAFSKLTITDKTSANHDFVDGSLKVYLDGALLVKGEDYTSGFDTELGGLVVEILSVGAAKSKIDSIIEFKYKTEYNIPDGETVSSINKELVNTSNLVIYTEQDVDFVEKTTTDTVVLPEWLALNGKKSGVLDKENRKVSWALNINALNQNLGQTTINDTLSEGQIYIEDSFKLYEYSLDKSGNPVKGQEITDSSLYTLTFPTKTNFTLVYNNLDKRILIEYETKLTGLAKENYTNLVNVIATGCEGNYTASVNDSKYDDFISKTGNVNSGGKAYTGDILNWNVKINESFSEIKEVVFTDKISTGHSYIGNTLKVLDKQNVEVEIPAENILVTDLSDGSQELVVKLGDIDSKATISYSTLIVADKGVISNNSSIEGIALVEHQSSVTNISVSLAASGGASGERRGILTINKTDQEGTLITTGEATFKLYRKLGLEEILVGEFTTTKGIFTVSGLQFGDYVLKETIAPEGYVIDVEKHDITISSQTELIARIENVNLEDARGNISIVKVDDKIQNLFLEGAEFDVLDETDKVIGHIITDVSGNSKIENLPFGKYIVRETKAPKNYDKLSVEFEVTVNKNNIDSEITIENHKTIPVVPYGKINIKKVDSVNENIVLEGAVFAVFDSTGKKVGEITTDVNGEASINVLTGSYRLVEITAPEGYNLKRGEVSVAVDAQNVEYINTVKNEKNTTPVSPSTATPTSSPSTSTSSTSTATPTSSPSTSTTRTTTSSTSTTRTTTPSTSTTRTTTPSTSTTRTTTPSTSTTRTTTPSTSTTRTTTPSTSTTRTTTPSTSTTRTTTPSTSTTRTTTPSTSTTRTTTPSTSTTRTTTPSTSTTRTTTTGTSTKLTTTPSTSTTSTTTPSTTSTVTKTSSIVREEVRGIRESATTGSYFESNTNDFTEIKEETVPLGNVSPESTSTTEKETISESETLESETSESETPFVKSTTGSRMSSNVKVNPATGDKGLNITYVKLGLVIVAGLLLVSNALLIRKKDEE